MFGPAPGPPTLQKKAEHSASAVTILGLHPKGKHSPYATKTRLRSAAPQRYHITGKSADRGRGMGYSSKKKPKDEVVEERGCCTGPQSTNDEVARQIPDKRKPNHQLHQAESITGTSRKQISLQTLGHSLCAAQGCPR